MAEQTIRRVRNIEYTTDDKNTWKRRITRDGTRTDWEPVSPSLEPVPEKSPLALMLVLEKQAPGEPKHWSLFVAREGESGSVYQVTGDATFMTYNHLRDVNPLNFQSYHTSYVLAYLGQGDQATVGRCVESQPPPQAANRKLVTENCQGWTVRVIESLCSEGLVEYKWIPVAKGLLESV